jgi:hypothetical protein
MMQGEVCRWKYDDMDDYWEASCGATWVFNEGGLKENDAKYCPKCGGLIIHILGEDNDAG